MEKDIMEKDIMEKDIMENNVMEHGMSVFENSEFGKLEVMYIDDKAYFPATECAKVLGYAEPEKAIRMHCKGVSKLDTPTNGGIQKKNFIPEGDLYRLIIKSNLPAAEKFESWVFDEVLPSIRKQGFYSALTDEKLLEVAFERCMESTDHPMLEDSLYKMQEALTMKRWELMERKIWPVRFDHHAWELNAKIEELWGGDALGAMRAKEHFWSQCSTKYGMSRIYGKWTPPKNPLKHHTHKANLERLIDYEIRSADARARMHLPVLDGQKLRLEINRLNEKLGEVKKIVEDLHRYLERDEPAEEWASVEDERDNLIRRMTSYMFADNQLKRMFDM